MNRGAAEDLPLMPRRARRLVGHGDRESEKGSVCLRSGMDWAAAVVRRQKEAHSILWWDMSALELRI